MAVAEEHDAVASLDYARVREELEDDGGWALGLELASDGVLLDVAYVPSGSDYRIAVDEDGRSEIVEVFEP